MAKEKQPQNESPFTFKDDSSSATNAPVVNENLGKEKKKQEKRHFGRIGKGETKPSKQVQGLASEDFSRQSSEVEQLLSQTEKSSSLNERSRLLAVSAVVALVLLPTLTVLPTGVFNDPSNMSLAVLIESVGKNIVGLGNWITGGPVTSGISIVFWQMLAAAIVGASLSLSGCIYQGALNNALASPSTLGVTSGGTLGTLVYTLLFGVPTAVGTTEIIRASELSQQLSSMNVFSYFAAIQGRAFFSLLGCFAIVGLIMTISQIAGKGKISKVALLIAGQVFASVIAGVVAVIHSYINFYGTNEQIEALQYVVGGNISSVVDPLSLSLLAVPFVIGAGIMMLLRFKLNALSFSSDEARTMGVNTVLVSNISIAVCTALTGFVISFVGAVGFVGFIVPHIARKMVGPDLKYLVPASIVFGAIFLMVTNYFMNMTGFLQGALGTFTSIVGAVFFLVVIIKERRAKNVQWI